MTTNTEANCGCLCHQNDRRFKHEEGLEHDTACCDKLNGSLEAEWLDIVFSHYRIQHNEPEPCTKRCLPQKDLKKQIQDGIKQAEERAELVGELKGLKTFDQLQFRHMWQSYQKRRIKELESDLQAQLPSQDRKKI